MQNGNMRKRYVIDIDGTICTQEINYAEAKPYEKRIAYINKLYDKGNIIILFTARGTDTGIDWKDITSIQLKEWGLKYHQLLFGKPSADYYIDDRMLSELVLDMEIGE